MTLNNFFSLDYFSEAQPKRILEVMNVPGLTKEHVASHLQVGFYIYAFEIWNNSV